MNQLAVLSVICAVVISGCSEAGDSTYRESSEARNVPTLHLVIDAKHSNSEAGDIREVAMEYHVQSNRPLQQDTFVLVREVKIMDDERVRDLLVVILAGETQSKKLSVDVGNAYYTSAKIIWVKPEVFPSVKVILPEPQERASLLPTWVSYTNAAGRRVENELLVEYPFNPYNVGKPAQISVKWGPE